MRSIVDSLAKTEDAFVLKHFFGAGGEPLQENMQGFMQSLLYQMLSRKPELLENLPPLRKLPNGVPNLGIVHLHELFLETLLELSKAEASIFLLVDALDECVDWCEDSEWNFKISSAQQ
jgi:hypothetical protein